MKETIIFEGEHLLWGNIGHLAVVLSFVASLLAFWGYYRSEKWGDTFWAQLAPKFLWVHALSVLAIFVILFSLIHGHYYEYQYVWQHSSNELPTHYMISCFWEGQEGSFLLWMFWHVVLSIVLYFRPTRLTHGALSVMMLAQAILTSMLLGVEVLGAKIGSSPFALLREVQPDMLNIPRLEVIGKEKYLSLVENGSGLNPLLQNYWMVIHPPTLFLGFAAATVPFAYLVSSFWKKDRTHWMQPVIPWTLFSVMILGAGIIMGGFWAYESLSFGGYWAWDPVENASLMPWLLLIAAVHLVLIYKNTGRYAVLTILLICFSFFLVLYATFLTRSGVLGEASVHSFTDLGLSGQLLLFIFMFVFLAMFSSFRTAKKALGWIALAVVLIGLNVLNYYLGFLPKPILNVLNLLGFFAMLFGWSRELMAQYPSVNKEENTWSREFWMFIGALVLLLSAFQIVFYTSAPVFNKLFDLQLAVQKEEFYNRFQLPFAIVIALLTGVGQFFYYRHTDKKQFWRDLFIPFAIALFVGILLVFVWKLYALHYLLLLLLSVYTIVANVFFMLRKQKAKWRIAGGSIAHAGFGLMLIGILVSSVNKQVITSNNIGRDYIQDSDADEKAIAFNRENMLLQKGDTVRIENYLVVYDTAITEAPDKFFWVKWMKLNSKGEITEQFYLKPNAQNNPQMGGLIANPDTRHYLHKDIYTHINHESSLEPVEEFDGFKNDTVQIGATFTTASGMRKVEVVGMENFKSEDDKLIRVIAQLKVESFGKPKTVEAALLINTETNEVSHEDAIVDEIGFLARFQTLRVDVQPIQLVITTAERRPIVDYIIMKAIVFPWVNLLWSGTVILVIGFTLSIFQRIKELRKWKPQA